MFALRRSNSLPLALVSLVPLATLGLSTLALTVAFASSLICALALGRRLPCELARRRLSGASSVAFGRRSLVRLGQ
ncbi:MAG: hypothetical protein ABR583_03215 [Gaiellaceae bacterium]